MITHFQCCYIIKIVAVVCYEHHSNISIMKLQSSRQMLPNNEDSEELDKKKETRTGKLWLKKT